MCGIVGAVAQRNVGSILIEGLRRLEYRGYDSAGVAILNEGELTRFRALGKVQELADRLPEDQPGHTPWCTTASSRITSPCARN